MAMIKLEGKTKLTGKTIFDGGPTPAEQAAATYITAVESADGESLESGVVQAYTDFIAGCFADGIWSSIKASCILAGARTLNGALVPLVGTAPTNNNFVSADYNRETGLIGNSSTKYLDSNRAANADPQNSGHISFYQAGATARTQCAIGSNSSSNYIHIFEANGVNYLRMTGGAYVSASGVTAAGLYAGSRSDSTTLNFKKPGSSVQTTTGKNSVSPSSLNSFIFAQNTNGSAAYYVNKRLSFYSIGEALDLAKLDSRVSTLMTDLATAI